MASTTLFVCLFSFIATRTLWLILSIHRSRIRENPNDPLVALLSGDTQERLDVCPCLFYVRSRGDQCIHRHLVPRLDGEVQLLVEGLANSQHNRRVAFRRGHAHRPPVVFNLRGNICAPLDQFPHYCFVATMSGDMKRRSRIFTVIVPDVDVRTRLHKRHRHRFVAIFSGGEQRRCSAASSTNTPSTCLRPHPHRSAPAPSLRGPCELRYIAESSCHSPLPPPNRGHFPL